jgi:predicted peroxiredoxin
MKKIGFLVLTVLLIMSCDHRSGHDNDSAHESQMVSDEEAISDGIFIHITNGYEDPHRVLMPLKMASIMLVDKDVIVYMDIDAVELLVKGSEDLSYEGFESAQTYLKQLVENQVGVYACPTCLGVAGFSPDDLMDGIQVADKEKFFDFTKGRIITLDY